MKMLILQNPSNEIVVARADEDTGSPTHYAIKASGQVCVW